MYKLIYFDVPGKAEAIRFLLHAANQEFEDVRMTMEDWPKVKDTMPTGMVPVLEVDGKKLPESLAILRYLAKKYGFQSNDDFEVACTDAVSEVINDLTYNFRPFYREKDPEIKKKHEEAFKSTIVPTFIKTMATLKQLYGKDCYLVGDKLSYADMLFYTVVDQIVYFTKEEVNLPEELKCVSTAVKSNEGIAKYLTRYK